MTATAEAKVTVTNEVGLHARPAVKLAKLAKSFPARVEMALSPEGPWFDAKSVVKVMAARVPKGAVLHLRASGEGASEAVEALADLVERNFDEGEVHAGMA